MWEVVCWRGRWSVEGKSGLLEGGGGLLDGGGDLCLLATGQRKA